MTTETLLTIVAPHAEMLKRMGWTCFVDPENESSLIVRWQKSPRESVLNRAFPDFAARIIADVCMEWLEKWAMGRKETTVRVSESAGEYVAKFTWWDDSTTSEHPTRLAALLALAAWCRKERGA